MLDSHFSLEGLLVERGWIRSIALADGSHSLWAGPPKILKAATVLAPGLELLDGAG